MTVEGKGNLPQPQWRTGRWSEGDGVTLRQACGNAPTWGESLLLVVDGGRVLRVGRVLEDDLRSSRDILGELEDRNLREMTENSRAALVDYHQSMGYRG